MKVIIHLFVRHERYRFVRAYAVDAIEIYQLLFHPLVQLFVTIEQIAMVSRLVRRTTLTFHTVFVMIAEIVAIYAVTPIALLHQRATTEREAVLMSVCGI